MTDSGYTAVEALAALAIIGLAVTGLGSGIELIGRGQSEASATLVRVGSERTLGRSLDQL